MARLLSGGAVMLMAPDRLQAEWLAMPSLGGGDMRALAALGISRKAITLAGGIGRAKIHRINRTWTPNPDGKAATILPVWADGAPSIYNAVEAPLLIDLLALDLADEGTWHYRIGADCAALGADWLELAHIETIPVTLFVSPLAWLRAECKGTVLLQYNEDAWRAEHALAQDEATAEWWRAA